MKDTHIMATKKAITTSRKTDPSTSQELAELAELDKLWRMFLRSKPLLPKDLCYEIERQERAGAAGQARRVTLASAEFGGKYHRDFANRDHDSAVTVATILLMARDWRDRLKDQLKLAEAQSLRLEMALMEQDDVEGLLAEAEAGRVDVVVS